MEVINKIEVYEINGEEIGLGKRKDINIISHWNREEFVVIKIGRNTYTVSAEKLEKAIRNATNFK